MPLYEGDFVRFFINDVERSDYVLEYERTASLCEIGDVFSVVVQSNIPAVPDPYDDVLIKEYWDGSLGNVLKGYVLETNQTNDAVIYIEGQDKSVLLAEYFIPQQIIANGETVDYWMNWVASQVGLTIYFGATSSAIVEEDTPLGLQYAADVVEMLERLGGYFVRYDSQNNRLETFRLQDSQPTITLTDTDNKINVMERTVGTKKTRNVVKVYGRVRFNPFTGEEETIFAKSRTNIPELLVDKVMAVVNPIIRKQSHAVIVATKILNMVNTIDDTQHYTLQGFYPNISYGQNAFVNIDTLNFNFYGSKTISTISARVDEEGVYTTITLGEKCDRVSIQLPTPPVYICSSGEGVGISWDAGDTFYPSNYGLSQDALTCSGIAVNSYDYQMLWTNDGFWRRYTNQGAWVKFMDAVPDSIDEDGYTIVGEDVKIIKLTASKPNWGTFYILGVWGNRNLIGRTIVYKTIDFGGTWTSVLLAGEKARTPPTHSSAKWPPGVPQIPKFWGGTSGTIPYDIAVSTDGVPYVVLQNLFDLGPPDD
jgi:hypothetical protein